MEPKVSASEFASEGDEAQRARIKRALIELCFEHGYKNTTLEMVLERAGIDQVAFERHFADLEGCFCDALRELSDRFFLAVAAAVAPQQGWRNQMRAAAYAMLGFFQADEQRARFMIVEVLSAGSEAQLIRDHGMELLFDLIDQGRGELADPDSVSRATAEAIGGAIFNRIQVAVEAGDLSVGTAMVPELMYTAVLPYLGTEAALEELRIAPPPGLDPGSAAGDA